MYTVVTVRIIGLQSSLGTTVYANGAAKGTIHGEGTLVLIFANLTTDVVISVTKYVPEGYPYYGYTHYIYPGLSWGTYGHNGVSYFCRASSQTAAAGVNATVTFRYDPLFFLYVRSDRGSPEGSGWYVAGTLARVAVTTPIEEGASTRYRFDKWTGNYVGDNSNNPVGFVFMDSPKMIEAVWKPQYRLTINSPYGQVSGAGWYDKDQTAAFSVTTQAEGTEGVRQQFSSWIGDFAGNTATGTVNMNAPKTITAVWKTQYLLTVDPKGGQVDKATQWLETGTSVSVTALSPCNVIEKKSRMVFLSWYGAMTATSNAVSLVMDSPKILIASWRTQYYLTIETKHGTASGEGWYDAGSIADFSVIAEIAMSPPFGSLGGRYSFAGWSGDSKAATAKASILMDAPHTVTATWTDDYLIVWVLAFAALTVVISVVALAKKGLIRKPAQWRNQVSRNRRRRASMVRFRSWQDCCISWSLVSYPVT